MIIEHAKAHGHGACVLHEDRVVSTLSGPNPLVCATHENQCYFYSCKKARRALMKRQAHVVEKAHREAQSTKTPPFSEWKPWCGVEHLAPGHYHAPEEGIEAIRAQLLETRRFLRVLLKDETSIKSLQYTCSKRDGVCVVVVVHGVPKAAEAIQLWLQRLDLEIPCRGEGLPSMS